MSLQTWPIGRLRPNPLNPRSEIAQDGLADLAASIRAQASVTGLCISPDLDLPMEAVTQTFGVLAVRGAGKSNLAVVMAEEMFRAGLPFVVVDPVGNWWGLRSSKDGRGPGLSLPIFGGLHGDVPLEKTAGHVIADLVVDERLSCVLDVFEFSEGDKIRFLIDFAERLYRRNQAPLHLFLEEADDYAPQRPMREQARLLRAWENVVRRGRSRGLGITMISQRSAALNKNVLTQIETLFVLRTTSPQDRKAIAGWVEYHGQSHDLLESLPGLETGEAWVWSPQWLRELKRFRVRERQTFDSSATPVQGPARRVATLADVDLGALQERMAATIERAKADDPRELRRRIAHLEKKLTEKPQQVVETLIEKVTVPVLDAGDVRNLQALTDSLRELSTNISDAALALQTALSNQAEPIPIGPSRALRRDRGSLGAQTAPESHYDSPVRTFELAGIPGDGRGLRGEGLTRPQQRVLDALAWLEAIGMPSGDRVQVAFIAGYSPNAGHFGNTLGSLNSAGLVAYPYPGGVQLSEAGRTLANHPARPGDTDELQRLVLAKLKGPQQRVLRVLLDCYPREISRDELASQARYSADAGHFGNTVGSLRSLGVVEYPTPGRVRASDLLFPERA